MHSHNNGIPLGAIWGSLLHPLFETAQVGDWLITWHAKDQEKNNLNQWLILFFWVMFQMQFAHTLQMTLTQHVYNFWRAQKILTNTSHYTWMYLFKLYRYSNLPVFSKIHKQRSSGGTKWKIPLKKLRKSESRDGLWKVFFKKGLALLAQSP